ncbi:MAG: hypothetical protein EBV03_08905 [Proteobacteria bacterium]|nr:hypothetical protein [Pseudomonadota bacterium]
MTTTLETPKTTQPARGAASSMDDVLIFATDNLKKFALFPASREGDNPLEVMFREVKNLRNLEQVAAKGQRSEVETAREAPTSSPSLGGGMGNTGKGGGWSMA